MANNKNRSVISEHDKLILREFLSCNVPKQYFDLDIRGNTKIDFHYNYEEVYDYSDALLRGEEIDLRNNFVGLQSVAINEEFKKILEVLGRRNPVLDEFCEKLTKAIAVIARVAKD